MTAPSMQGEHVFNALNALASGPRATTVNSGARMSAMPITPNGTRSS